MQPATSPLAIPNCCQNEIKNSPGVTNTTENETNPNYQSQPMSNSNNEGRTTNKDKKDSSNQEMKQHNGMHALILKSISLRNQKISFSNLYYLRKPWKKRFLQNQIWNDILLVLTDSHYERIIFFSRIDPFPNFFRLWLSKVILWFHQLMESIHFWCKFQMDVLRLLPQLALEKLPKSS